MCGPSDYNASVPDTRPLIEWAGLTGDSSGPIRDISFKWAALAVTPASKAMEQRVSYNRDWLGQQLWAYYGGLFTTMPLEDMVNAVVTVCCSSRSDAELQAEVRKVHCS